MLGPVRSREPSVNSLLRLIFGLSLMLMAGLANANKPADITESEMRLLPRYCPDTMGFGYGDSSYNTSPRAGHWVSLMGKDFWNIHHYCWGLINLSRAQKSGLPRQTRRGMLESVQADYKYVINKSSRDFIMLPEIYTRLGDVQLLLMQANKANESFARARKLKPDYWPAYSHWAEYLLHSGQKSEALKITKAGLQHAPDSKVLLELLRVLGGKPSQISRPDRGNQDTGAAAETLEADTPDVPAVSSEAARKTP